MTKIVPFEHFNYHILRPTGAMILLLGIYDIWYFIMLILYTGLDNPVYSKYISKEIASYRFWHLLFLGPFKVSTGAVFLVLGRKRDAKMMLYYSLNIFLLFVPLVSCFLFVFHVAFNMKPFNSFIYFNSTLNSYDSILEIIFCFTILVIQFLRTTQLITPFDEMLVLYKGDYYDRWILALNFFLLILGSRDVFRFFLQYIFGAVSDESYTFFSSILKSGSYLLFWVHLVDGPIILFAYFISHNYCKKRIPKFVFQAFLITNLLLGIVFVLHLIDLYNHINQSVKIGAIQGDHPKTKGIAQPLCMTIFYGVVEAVVISFLGIYYTDIKEITPSKSMFSYQPSTSQVSDTTQEEFDYYSMNLSIPPKQDMFLTPAN